MVQYRPLQFLESRTASRANSRRHSLGGEVEAVAGVDVSRSLAVASFWSDAAAVVADIRTLCRRPLRLRLEIRHGASPSDFQRWVSPRRQLAATATGRCVASPHPTADAATKETAASTTAPAAVRGWTANEDRDRHDSRASQDWTRRLMMLITTFPSHIFYS